MDGYMIDVIKIESELCVRIHNTDIPSIYSMTNVFDSAS